MREFVCRPTGVIARDIIDNARVAYVEFDPGRLADLLHADAARLGVIQELASTVEYRLSQCWAAAFDAAGFDGVHYQPRFSSDRVSAIAVFGGAGRPANVPAVVTSRSVTDVLLENGYAVLDVPASDELTSCDG